MANLDVFKQDAFSTTSLTSTVRKTDYVPRFLGDLKLFTPKPIRTEIAMIDQQDTVLNVIQTSPRGAAPDRRARDLRKAHSVPTVRIAKTDTIWAHEIQNIRATGSETELMQVQTEVAGRQAALRQDIELTHENMRLGAVQGQVLDADGSVIVDWYQTMGVAQAAEIDFDLDNAAPASGALRKKCTEVIRAAQTAAKGGWTMGTTLYGLCGDAFWDDLVAHPEVEKTYLNTSAAAQRREGVAYESMNYGGITFVNYRGTDDGTSVAIGADKCKFFPAGAPGVFEAAWSPAETFDYVNTPGQPLYSMIVPDEKRNQYVDVEVYSYPLFICTRPGMLQRARRT